MSNRVTTEEKRRELFEAWWISENRQMHVVDTKCLTFDFIQAFRVWSAALDAVLIELPTERSLSASDDPWYVRELCIDAIESTGLGLKVKS